jgi:hypothetical protein
MQRSQGKPHRLGTAPQPAMFRGVCLLCDEYVLPGQLVGRAGRYGWVHVPCADAGHLPPTAVGRCGAYTRTGHACRMAVVPGQHCPMHVRAAAPDPLAELLARIRK